MNFVSYAFLALFGIVLFARFTSGKRSTELGFLRTLLVASLIFYGWHVPEYLLLILGSTAVDYVAAKYIGGLPREDPRRHRALLVSLAMNLGMLGLFKYTGFALDTARELLGALGLSTDQIPAPELVLPIGISFYTFQSMSYTIDVYRGRLKPEERFETVLLFVSFFPQLVAGPIVRAGEFLYQLRRPRPVRAPVLFEGAYLMIRGFFLKLVLADNIAPIVDYYFPIASKDATAGASVALLSVLLFSGQIFCDFAGYSSIARGVAYILGFRFPVNFRAPYASSSFSELWRRWHITLSRWLKDYLYVPLGGNRLGHGRTYANLATVMLLGGLWHGAAWTFVIWGAIHGAALALERLLGLNDPSGRPLWLRIVWFFVVQLSVLVAWVFFRARSVDEAFGLLDRISTGDWSVEGCFPLLWGLLFLVPVVVIHLRTILEEKGRLQPMTVVDKSLASGIMFFFILTCYGSGDAFIYFQF